MKDFLENHWNHNFESFFQVLTEYRQHLTANGQKIPLGQRKLLIEFTEIYLHLLKHRPDLDHGALTDEFECELEAAFYPN